MTKDNNLILVPDIHSDMKIIENLNKIRAKLPESKVIYLGDFFDRGDQSYEVFDYILNDDNSVKIYGNHDLMLDKFLRGYDYLLGNGEELWKYIFYIFENDTDITFLQILKGYKFSKRFNELELDMSELRLNILTNLFFRTWTNKHIVRSIFGESIVRPDIYLSDEELLDEARFFMNKYSDEFDFVREKWSQIKFVHSWSNKYVEISHSGIVDNPDITSPILLSKRKDKSNLSIIGHFMIGGLIEDNKMNKDTIYHDKNAGAAITFYNKDLNIFLLIILLNQLFSHLMKEKKHIYLIHSFIYSNS